MKRGTDDYTVVLGRNNINIQLTAYLSYSPASGLGL